MRNAQQPVAVVAMEGVFPGAPTLDAFWTIIANGRDTAREVPRERWCLWPEVDAGEPPKADSVASRRACVIDGFEPDLRDLRIDESTLSGLDPLFRLLLHTGRLAWRGAATADVDPKRAGVIVGCLALPTEAVSRFSEELLAVAFRPALDVALGRPVTPAAVPASFLTPALNRHVCGLPAVLLARALGLGGFAYTLDAACASSLYAVRLAADALRDGRLDAVICGGVSRPDSLYTQMGFSQLRALSPSGRCAPFDRRADGLVVGEGCGLLVLKRLDDAIAHGDQIHGLIAGVGLSNDLGANLMSPSSEGQVRAMRDAYRQSGWRPVDVDLVECHGTGTPVGDSVEFASMCSAWGDADAGACVMGSVKSNVGHLLTAAGAAGIIKVLLALQSETLPPTANFQSPADRIALGDSPFRVLTRAAAWKPRDPQTPRRAAVSAFGFGGVNAHLLVEEFRPAPRRHRPAAAASLQSQGTRPAPKPAIAIVGMGAHFGPFENLDELQAQLLDDAPQPPAAAAEWRGLAAAPGRQAYRVEAVEVPAGRFRIPPAEVREMLPQQSIMLEVAAAAFDDAEGGRDDATGDRPGLGVYLGIGLDLDTTNFHFRWNAERRHAGEQPGADREWIAALRDAAHPPLSANRTMGALGSIAASRLARAFRAGGPSYAVSCEALSGLRALESAVAALMRGEIDTALVGAVDFACDPRAVAADAHFRRFAPGAQARPFDPRSAGTVAGEGAAAMVLRRLPDALARGDRIYAVVRGSGAACGGEPGRPDPGAYLRALDAALTDAGWQADQIDYVAGNGSGDPREDAAEGEALSAFAARRGARTCFVGSVVSRIGHAGAAAGLGSLVGAALCLRQRILPGLCAGTGGDAAIPPPGTGLEIPARARYWLKDRAEGPRRAVVAATGIGGDCAHVLIEAPPPEAARAPSLRPNGQQRHLFVVEGEHASALTAHLGALERLAREGTAPVGEVARRWHETPESSEPAGLGIGLLAADPSELRERIGRARGAVATGEAVAENGVYFSPAPLAGGETAFVFPGSGNQYPHMGRGLAVRFPDLLETLDGENERLASQFAQAAVWRDGTFPSLSPRDAVLAHVWFGALASDAINAFGVRPDAVIGYSLGESTGLIATRAWRQRDQMFERLRESALFSDQLAGECTAARRTWGLSAAQRVDWRAGVVDRPVAEVRRALEGRRWIYLLIVNSPAECVVGGHREAVDDLVRALDCAFHPLEAVTTVHCDVVRRVAESYRELHLQDTRAPARVRFYSAAWGHAYPVTAERAADSILAQALAPFDFRRVIERAYADGVRVFVEVGPGRSCSRMINSILDERPHLALPVFPGTRDEPDALLQALARLVAERVPVDFSRLHRADPAGKSPAVNGSVNVRLDKPPFKVPVPTRPHPTVVPLAPRRTQTTARRSPPAARPQPLHEQVAGARDAALAHARAEDTFVRLAGHQSRLLARAIELQQQLQPAPVGRRLTAASASAPARAAPDIAADTERPVLDRDACVRFATGRIGDVLGTAFAEADTFPTRVRLPDEPLMLVDRILEIDAVPKSLGRGRVVTEHDVRPDAWYLDNDRVPTCIAVEAGQADLFLSGYLGIDFETRGLAVYRLLDARITFHDALPRPGSTIRYDIRIEEFFRQGETWLFRFNFDASLDGAPLLSMRDGCAGFFTAAELEAGRGIARSSLDRLPAPRQTSPVLPPVAMQREHYGEAELEALRGGDLAGCFGEAFAGLPLERPQGIPAGRMNLVDRILELDPEGGRYGHGLVRGEADIDPQDWFLVCHFVDDQVMPGTLMYECCLHTLRVYLLRFGWVGEKNEFVYEPVPGIAGTLKCRGQVTANTRRVQYEISIRELGYDDSDQTPFAIADALMYADGKPIVQMRDMSLRLSGLTRARVTDIWREKSSKSTSLQTSPGVLFDRESILAFAVGKPSEAFGEPYRIFDQDRRIARLPGPPYQFLDRITRIEGCEAFVLEAGGVVEARYDVPPDAWYFDANRQPDMPFCVLLEIALQPCGWLAAYLGSALTSETDLSFRNLGGSAVQRRRVHAGSGELVTTIKITDVSRSGGMIIQSFDFSVRDGDGVVYEGDTYFGFFSESALRSQVGIRNAALDRPGADQEIGARSSRFPDAAPFPADTLRMIEDIEAFLPHGGPRGGGYVRGGIDVDPNAWFFKAHFFQDPVWPGSLGLESVLQLMKFAAVHRSGGNGDGIRFECPALGRRHEWVYRGQVLPVDHRVTVHAHFGDAEVWRDTISADGHLEVDGRVIYEMKNFSIKVSSATGPD